MLITYCNFKENNMTKYAFIYHGGSAPSSPEEGKKVMAAWQAWMGSIGDSLTDGGNPFGQSLTVNSDQSITNDGGANPASGYTLVEANSVEDATEIAKKCPILESGGSVEICEAMAM
jgi:hypothetical protein